jgi:hypothetical protein
MSAIVAVGLVVGAVVVIAGFAIAIYKNNQKAADAAVAKVVATEQTVASTVKTDVATAQADVTKVETTVKADASAIAADAKKI